MYRQADPDKPSNRSRKRIYFCGLAGKGNIFVVVESVYSMDGDLAPLKEMVELCEKYGANLLVDEAHGAGVFGPKCRGLVSQLGLEKKVFGRIVTF